MKLLILINGLGVGGAETQVLALAGSLLDHGYEVGIVLLTNDKELIDRLDLRIKLICIDLVGIKSLPRGLYKLIRYVKSWKPDIIHSHLFQANLLSRIVKMRFPDLKIVNTTHCSYDLSSRTYNPYQIYRWTRKLVNYHSAVSQVALDQLKDNNSVDPKNAAVVYNGLPIANYLVERKEFASNAVFNWVAVGRLIELKNYPLLIQAAEQLKKQGVEFFIDIAGDGPEKNALSREIKQRGLEENIRLLGFVSDISALLLRYDGYILCSNTEGLPMALLEAMASGLVILATDVGEIPVILEATKGGKVIPKGDQVALTEAMQRLQLSTNEKLVQMVQNNQTYLRENFDLDKVTNQWQDIYINICEK